MTVMRTPERIAMCKACSKKLYQERREWGVCIICGKPRRNGETTLACVHCTKARAEYRERNRQHLRETTKERMNRYRAAGLCIYCGKPAVPGETQCQYHKEYYSKVNAKRRKRKKEAKNGNVMQDEQATT